MDTHNQTTQLPLLHAPSRVISVAAQVIHRTPSKVALTLYVAALAYQLPIWNIPQEIQLIYFQQRTFSTTTVSRKHPDGGVTVRRKFRDFPPHSIQIINKQPTLTLPFLLLDFLTLKNPYSALVTAEAIFRRLVGGQRTPSEEQRTREEYTRALLEYYARTYISEYYQARVLRRIRLLSAFSESPLESVMHVVMLQLRRVSYTQQQPVHAARHTFYGDGALPRLHAILEADGQRKYLDDPHKVKEKYREKLIKRAGWRVIRFSTEEFWHPQLVKLVCGRLGVGLPRWLRHI